MFGKAKGNSHEKDKLFPPAPQLQNLTPQFGRVRIRRKSPPSVPA